VCNASRSEMRLKSTARWLAPVLVLAAIAAGAFYWWQQRQESAIVAPEPPRAEAPAPSPAPAEPQLRHPVWEARPELPEQPAAAAPLPALGESDKLVQDELVGLVGREPVLAFLSASNYVRRFVTTVDNLPRKHAAVRLWPVNPAPDRFATEEQANATYVSASNSRRYEPLVRFVESVNTGAAVALYVRLYPLCQRAYEELGYPGRYFNDRLIEVIDHLLATPEMSGPILLTRPEVRGPIKPERPWVMYQFADPALESRSAGQKILIRMGSENATRLKAKLADLRRQLAPAAPKP